MEKAIVKNAGTAAKEKPEERAKKSVTGKILFSLPFIAIAAIVVHCGTMLAVELFKYMTGVPLADFDRWYTPLLYAVAYSVPFAVSFTAWKIYNRRLKKAKRAE